MDSGQFANEAATADSAAVLSEGVTAMSGEDAVSREIRRRRLDSGWSQNALARRAGFARQYISRAENSTHGLPSVNLVAILDTVLEAGGALVKLRDVAATKRRRRREDVLLGRGETCGVRTNAAPLIGPTRNGASTGASPSRPLLAQVDHPLGRRPSGPEGVDIVDLMDDGELVDLTPSRVGWHEVEQVRAVTAALAATENMFGGGPAAVTAPAALRWAMALLSARATREVGAALYEAVGNLAGVVGFVAFDVGDAARARRLSAAALWCAEQGSSWALRGAVLADVARQHMAARDLDDALSAVEFALVRDDRLSATACAAIGVVRAQVLAALGRHAEARVAVERADTDFARRESTAGAEPPWLSYYDAAEHAGSTAKALMALDLHAGRPGIATERLGVAVAGHRSNYPRSRAFSSVRLAALQMRVGDPREAVTTGRAALERTAGISSGRLDTELRRLARACHGHPRIPDVVDLAADLLRR